MKDWFEKFLKSSFELEIWSRGKIIFRSKKPGIKGLIDFIKKYGSRFKDLIVFDKIVGQGVALLAAYLKTKEVYGKTGSKLAVKTLKKFKIKFYFKKIVPKILNKKRDNLCPIERLSSKKIPKEFYNLVKKS